MRNGLRMGFIAICGAGFFLGLSMSEILLEKEKELGLELHQQTGGEKFVKSDYVVCIAEKYLDADTIDENYCMPSADLHDYKIERAMHYKQGVSELTLSFPDDTIAIVWVHTSAIGVGYGQ
jgi:hypothetical protein